MVKWLGMGDGPVPAWREPTVFRRDAGRATKRAAEAGLWQRHWPDAKTAIDYRATVLATDRPARTGWVEVVDNANFTVECPEGHRTQLSRRALLKAAGAPEGRLVARLGGL